MRSREFITELRRNPEQNQQRDRGYQTVQQLLQGRDLTNIGVSMTEIAKLGINPRSKYNTPIGIYFYPADYYLKQQGRVPFQERAPYVNVFEYEGRVLNTTNYSNKDFEQDIAGLKKLYPQHEAGIDYDWEQCLDPDLNDFSPLVDIPAGWIWFVVWRLSDNILGDMAETTEPQAPATSVKWNHVLRQLGYDAVVDPGHEVIHKGEPTQGVVLNPRVIRPITQIQNQQGAKAYDTLGQKLLEPDTWQVVKWIARNAQEDPRSFQPDTSTNLPNSVRSTPGKIHRLFVRFIEIMQQHPDYWTKFDNPQQTAQAVMTAAPQRLQVAIQAVYTQWLAGQHGQSPAEQPGKKLRHDSD